MTSPKFRRNLLLSLFVLAVLLIAIKILLNSVLQLPDSEEKFVDANEISQRFMTILDDFGIEEKLIKVNKSKDKFSGYEISSIKVQVPKDLSIPEILLDIYQSYRKDSLRIYSLEKLKGSKSTLVLMDGKSEVLRAEFDYSKNIIRNKGSLAFIIKDVDPGYSATVSLIESSTKLNFLIRPDSKFIRNLDLIKENGKQFSILIDDDTREQKYKLGPGYSEQRVVAVVKTLVTDFASGVYFVIDDKSEFYNSSNREVLSRELSKRNIKLLTFKNFVQLDNNENLIDNFYLGIENVIGNEGATFLLDEDAYQSIIPEIKKFEKRGYRVINSSLLLQFKK